MAHERASHSKIRFPRVGVNPIFDLASGRKCRERSYINFKTKRRLHFRSECHYHILRMYEYLRSNRCMLFFVFFFLFFLDDQDPGSCSRPIYILCRRLQSWRACHAENVWPRLLRCCLVSACMAPRAKRSADIYRIRALCLYCIFDNYSGSFHVIRLICRRSTEC